MKSNEILMYSTSWCSDCHRAKALFNHRNIPYREIDIDYDPAAEALVRKVNNGRRPVPTLFIDGAYYGNPPLRTLANVLDQWEVKHAAAAEHHPLVIIGTGPAGLTAALYTARANLAPLVLKGPEPGGQLMTTTDVENFPGFPKGIMGPELMAQMEEQAVRFGAGLRWGAVTRADFSERPFRLVVDDEQVVSADSVIISTGASARYLGLENEKRLLGRGVSACATCDGAFFRNQALAVVGGGDTALEEALFLTRFATSVTVIHRREELRASKIMQDRAFAHPKIRFLWNAMVTDVLGDSGVTGLQLRNILTGADSTLGVTGLFVAIGHQPNTALFTGQLEMDNQGYLLTRPRSTATSIPGVFASGDVQDHVFRQAITAAGTGCMAAMEAERWLAEHILSRPSVTSMSLASEPIYSSVE